jgi:hypothetical protein
VHLSTFFKKHGGTQSELFSTQSQPNRTQNIVSSRIDHTATSPRQEDLDNQDYNSLAKHSGAADEV